MSRLIAFGCSNTYGHGLPDCFTPPLNSGPLPSKYAWPKLIADQLGLKCINLSSPGSSNKKIWHNIINFKFKDGDIVFILWSLPQRYSFYENKKTVFEIGDWMIESDPKSKSYYKYLYSKYDAKLQSKLFVNHANLYLKEKKIKVYNMIIEKKEMEILEISNMRQNHIPIYIYDNYLYQYPKALDNSHPGVEAHLAFAKDILSYLDIKETNIPIQKKLPFFERVMTKINRIIFH